jgi:metal-responsive CopG/Arc/MetJ family transcriptional regulator
MSPKKAYTFLIDLELLEALKALKDRDAAPESETIRRALREYLKKRGVLKAPKKGR